MNYKSPWWKFCLLGEHLSGDWIAGTPLVLKLGVKTKEVINIVGRGILDSCQFMVNPNQCLESFENRHWDRTGFSAWPVLITPSLCMHTRHGLEMSEKHPFGPHETRETNRKWYNHEIDRQDCESNWGKRVEQTAWAVWSCCLTF